MSLLHKLLGTPLANDQVESEQVGVLDGVPVFGLDALGSAAYGPEAALTVLLPVGLLGLHYILPISAIIVALLMIVFFSYLQTISAYPNGGGAYTVAGENLGKNMGLVAGAALMLDYLLNVCVGISTGIGALVSALPKLQPHTLAMCLGVLAVLGFVNLRGTRETGMLWRLPTAVFVGTLLTVVGVGLYKVLHGGVHTQTHAAPVAAAGVGTWMLLRAFASGCTALTGVEAVSNGVRNFKEPKEQTAKRTLTLIVGILAVLLVGLAVLVHSYGIMATAPGVAGYQSVLSLVTAAVMGRGIFYNITMGAVLVVLSLSANTSFADFPNVCRLMAIDGYMPKAFKLRGRRLVYTVGIVSLTATSAGVLTVFGGVTDRLIPLFAIGAFLAFTFSQAGMVEHWRNSELPRARLYLAINLVGAIVTGATTLIVFVAKFTEGAWLTMLVLVPLVLLTRAIHKHYERVRAQNEVAELDLSAEAGGAIFLLPVEHWNRASVAALRFASTLGGSLQVLHVTCEGDDEECENMDAWRTMLEQSADRCCVQAPKVVEVKTSYRAITGPLFRYVLRMELEHPGSTIAVVFPEVVAERWYQHVLHNYRSLFLKGRLFFGGRRRIAIMTVPWRLGTDGAR